MADVVTFLRNLIDNSTGGSNTTAMNFSYANFNMTNSSSSSSSFVPLHLLTNDNICYIINSQIFLYGNWWIIIILQVLLLPLLMLFGYFVRSVALIVFFYLQISFWFWTAYTLVAATACDVVRLHLSDRCIGANFGKQTNRRFCGVQSICIVLNALGIEPSNNTTTFLEGDFWEYGMSRAVEKEEVDKQGMTLDQCATLLGGQDGVTVRHYRTSQVGQQEFRKEVEVAMMSDSSEVIVNYHMGALGRGTLGGHFSPLGGYSAARDMALVMDVWPDTVECWTTLDNLWKSMDLEDRANDPPTKRGFIVVTRD